ncbi:hypothetical protein [Paraburkholderia sp. RL17-337-BIB-A]|uniref:hypothetical protein n=1 Tax=Paraburkholderia sp. RL17-337-BIB-A TaxID=3031636 RepID=UPI0038BCEFCE
MKRSDELVRSILELLENSEEDAINIYSAFKVLAAGDESKESFIRHHVRIMEDKGLVSVSNAGRVRLTWDGHDALKPTSGIFG